ncbi:MAG: hypothetical protein JWO86_1004 [Myxococcaceae bacterium]|nr:hypothetical protein [Myxococcaceae bacterium]
MTQGHSTHSTRSRVGVAAADAGSYAGGVTFSSSAAVVVLALLGAGCEHKSNNTTAPPPPAASASAALRGADVADAGGAHPQFAKVEFPEVHIRPGVETKVRVAWKSPPGTGVNEEAPFKVRWSHSDALAEAPADVKATGTSAREGFDIQVKPLAGTPNATLTGVIDLVVCDVATHAVCVPVRRKIEIEFVVNKSAPPAITVTVDLPQAKAI